MDAPDLSHIEQKVEINRIDSLRPFVGIAAVAISGICAFTDMYCTQPLLPLLVQLFHTSKAAAGLTVSATTLGVAVSAPFVGSYTERFNRKRTIVVSIFALAIPTLLAATAKGLPELVFWRFFQGILMPGIFASAIAYVTEEWSETTVSVVMAIYVSGTVLGGFLGRLITGIIAEHYGWQWAFVVLAGVNVGGGLIVSGWLPHSRNGGHVRRKTAPSTYRTAPAEHQLLRMLRHLKNADLLITFAIGFNLLFALVTIFTYVTFHLAARPYSFSTSQLSFLFAVYLVGLVATPAGGVLLTRIDVRKAILWAIMLSIAGAFLTLTPPLWTIILGLTICSSAAFISQAAAMTHLRQAAPPGARVSAAGLYLSFYYIGGTIAGIAPGYAWELGGWTACVALAVSVQLLTVGLILFGWSRRSAQRIVPAV